MFFFNIPLKWITAILVLAETAVILVIHVAQIPFTPWVIGAYQCILFFTLARIGRWRVLQQVAPGYGRVQVIRVKGSLNPRVVKQVKRGVDRAARKVRVIVVTIDSGGGEISSARAIVELIGNHTRPVKILVVNQCMSAAVLIACAVPLQNRFIFPEAGIMIHGGKKGAVKKATSDTYASDAWLKGVNRSDEGYNGWFASHIEATTRLDASFLESLFATGGDLYFRAKEACSNGVVNTIIK